ncbi:MAG: hypothetical protein HYY62_03350 [Deltaproteobacteria bacterium]|nr:hypothetical protein [Deltaproteobacteria bacterium]
MRKYVLKVCSIFLCLYLLVLFSPSFGQEEEQKSPFGVSKETFAELCNGVINSVSEFRDFAESARAEGLEPYVMGGTMRGVMKYVGERLLQGQTPEQIRSQIHKGVHVREVLGVASDVDLGVEGPPEKVKAFEAQYREKLGSDVIADKVGKMIARAVGVQPDIKPVTDQLSRSIQQGGLTVDQIAAPIGIDSPKIIEPTEGFSDFYKGKLIYRNTADPSTHTPTQLVRAMRGSLEFVLPGQTTSYVNFDLESEAHIRGHVKRIRQSPPVSVEGNKLKQAVDKLYANSGNLDYTLDVINHRDPYGLKPMLDHLGKGNLTREYLPSFKKQYSPEDQTRRLQRAAQESKTLGMESPPISSHDGMLFHWTAEQHVPAILEHGFLQSVSEKAQTVHGASQGSGVYFAQTPLESAGYGNSLLMMRFKPGSRFMDLSQGDGKALYEAFAHNRKLSPGDSTTLTLFGEAFHLDGYKHGYVVVRNQDAIEEVPNNSKVEVVRSLAKEGEMDAAEALIHQHEIRRESPTLIQTMRETAEKSVDENVRNIKEATYDVAHPKTWKHVDLIEKMGNYLLSQNDLALTEKVLLIGTKYPSSKISHDKIRQLVEHPPNATIENLAFRLADRNRVEFPAPVLERYLALELPQVTDPSDQRQRKRWIEVAYQRSAAMSLAAAHGIPISEKYVYEFLDRHSPMAENKVLGIVDKALPEVALRYASRKGLKLSSEIVSQFVGDIPYYDVSSLALLYAVEQDIPLTDDAILRTLQSRSQHFHTLLQEYFEAKDLRQVSDRVLHSLMEARSTTMYRTQRKGLYIGYERGLDFSDRAINNALERLSSGFETLPAQKEGRMMRYAFEQAIKKNHKLSDDALLYALQGESGERELLQKYIERTGHTLSAKKLEANVVSDLDMHMEHIESIFTEPEGRRRYLDSLNLSRERALRYAAIASPEIFRSYLNHPHPDMQVDVMKIAHETHFQLEPEMIYQFLKNPKYYAKKEAITYAIENNVPLSSVQFIALLKDPAFQEKEHLLTVLKTRNVVIPQELFLSLLGNPNAAVRKAVLQYARHKKVDIPNKLLNKLIQDSDSDVASEAKRYLTFERAEIKYAQRLKQAKEFCSSMGTVLAAEEMKEAFFSLVDLNPERLIEFNRKLLENPAEFFTSYTGFVATETAAKEGLRKLGTFLENPRIHQYPRLKSLLTGLQSGIAQKTIPLTAAMVVMDIVHNFFNELDRMQHELTDEEKALIDQNMTYFILYNSSLIGKAGLKAIARGMGHSARFLVSSATAASATKWALKGIKAVRTFGKASEAMCVAEAGTGVGAAPAAIQLAATFVIDEFIGRGMEWTINSYDKVQKETSLKSALKDARYQLVALLEDSETSPEDMEVALLNLKQAFGHLVDFYQNDVRTELQKGLEKAEKETKELKEIVHAGPQPGIIGYESVEREQRRTYEEAKLMLEGSEEFGIVPLEKKIMTEAEKNAQKVAGESIRKIKLLEKEQKQFYDRMFNKGFYYQHPDEKRKECIPMFKDTVPGMLTLPSISPLASDVMDRQYFYEDSVGRFVYEHHPGVYDRNLTILQDAVLTD